MYTRPSRPSERGQATPLWAIVLLLAALLLVPVAAVARATIERTEARSAADAAALAGALDGEAAARSIAAANGARLIDYTTDGDEVEVTVVVGERRATARARREVVPADDGNRHVRPNPPPCASQVRCRRSGRPWRWSR